MKASHSAMKLMPSISPVAVGTTGTGQTGVIVDRRGFDGVEFIAQYGAITSTAAVFTAIVKEGDVTGTLTSIADGDLIGTEADLGLGAAVRTDGAGDKVAKKIAYIGKKRYVQINIKSTATAAPPVSAAVLLYNPESTSALV